MILNIVFWAIGVIILLIISLAIFSRLISYNPKKVQSEKIYCKNNSPKLKPEQKIKVMTYNVQFMAGKNYVFFFDTPDFSGADRKPDKEDVSKTLNELAQIIRSEDPDFILLQEVDDGAARTDKVDQLSSLLELLPEDYCCHTSTFYWKSLFVPHPKIWGAVGLKLSIISKFFISNSIRYALATYPNIPIIKNFTAKRPILEAHIPIDGEDKEFIILNTHLEAFVEGSNIMNLQVRQVDDRLSTLNSQEKDWVIGGDFNLLPPTQYEQIFETHKIYYNPKTEIKDLYEKYNIIPSFPSITGKDKLKWFTYNANDPAIDKPDRTLDYLLFSPKLRLIESYVLQAKAEFISDHFPVIGIFQLSPK